MGGGFRQAQWSRRSERSPFWRQDESEDCGQYKRIYSTRIEKLYQRVSSFDESMSRNTIDEPTAERAEQNANLEEPRTNRDEALEREGQSSHQTEDGIFDLDFDGAPSSSRSSHSSNSEYSTSQASGTPPEHHNALASSLHSESHFPAIPRSLSTNSPTSAWSRGGSSWGGRSTGTSVSGSTGIAALSGSAAGGRGPSACNRVEFARSTRRSMIDNPTANMARGTEKLHATSRKLELCVPFNGQFIVLVPNTVLTFRIRYKPKIARFNN
ncbi:hypothetical protein BDZ89DRAFT_1044011 [Hymenopellis radicata]|nr:hypothetical protein BDZ89DRAFT_1044011 [Hymenopellis radicata]